MQDLMAKLERQYQSLLTDTNFQDQIAFSLNSMLHTQFEFYPGLTRQIIFQENAITLYHYQALTKTRKKNSTFPVLILYAFINRPSILDIQADKSFIRKLLEHNHDIYLLDWGDPRSEDHQKTFRDYIEYLHLFIQKIKSPKINLLAICQGGTLSLCYASLYPQKIHKLITMVTPVDFQDSVLTGLLKNIDTHKLWKTYGNIPGYMLSYALQSLKPFRWSKVLSQTIDYAFFLRMEKWINDCPDHPGLVFHEFVYHFYQKNKLVRGQYFCGKERIDLSTLRMPILNIIAKQDHLVPPASSIILKDLTGSLDYHEIYFSGGHIGVFVSQKALESIPTQISQFIYL